MGRTPVAGGGHPRCTCMDTWVAVQSDSLSRNSSTRKVHAFYGKEKCRRGVGIYLSTKLFVCNRATTRWSEKAKKWRTVEGYEPGGISRPDIRHFGPGAFPILRTGAGWIELERGLRHSSIVRVWVNWTAKRHGENCDWNQHVRKKFGARGLTNDSVQPSAFRFAPLGGWVGFLVSAHTRSVRRHEWDSRGIVEVQRQWKTEPRIEFRLLAVFQL